MILELFAELFIVQLVITVTSLLYLSRAYYIVLTCFIIIGVYSTLQERTII